jgi:hypothetical protein
MSLLIKEREMSKQAKVYLDGPVNEDWPKSNQATKTAELDAIELARTLHNTSTQVPPKLLKP